MIARHADTAIALIAALTTASVVAALVELLGPANGLAAQAGPIPRDLVDIAPMTSLAPFGKAATIAADTRGLALRGVMLARPAAASTALIAAGGGRTLAYRVGETLPGGAVLDSVEYDLVTLRADGTLVTLGFPMAEPRAGMTRRSI